MKYKVIRKEVKTGRIFENICSQEQINNICKYPISLYSIESIELIKEEQTKTHTYYFRLRPPMPGCQPKDGLIETSSNSIIHNGREYWGTATYNRKLTKNELYDYDLDI